MKSKEIDEYIKEHYQANTAQEIAKATGLTLGAIQNRIARIGLKKEKVFEKPKDIQDVLKEDMELAAERLERRLDKKKIEFLLAENEKIKETLDSYLSLAESKGSHEIKPKYSSGKSEATAVILISDTHVEEVVEAESVGGMNEYNPDIAKERFDLLWQNGLKLIQKEQQNAKIDEAVFGILGDLISNDIHDELKEMCAMEPNDAIEFAQELIRSGIHFMLNNSKLKMTFICKSGNHGRTTKKIQTNEDGHSLEYLLYKNLAREFKSESRINFIVEKSYHTYLQVYDKTIRFHHGHEMKGGNGIGGLLVPVNRSIAKWNVSRRADIDCCGHFHSYHSTPNVIINGSMIGYNAYAMRKGFSAEPPQQALFLIDKKRGKTVTEPILFN